MFVDLEKIHQVNVLSILSVNVCATYNLTVPAHFPFGLYVKNIFDGIVWLPARIDPSICINVCVSILRRNYKSNTLRKANYPQKRHARMRKRFYENLHMRKRNEKYENEVK